MSPHSGHQYSHQRLAKSNWMMGVGGVTLGAMGVFGHVGFPERAGFPILVVAEW